LKVKPTLVQPSFLNEQLRWLGRGQWRVLLLPLPVSRLYKPQPDIRLQRLGLPLCTGGQWVNPRPGCISKYSVRLREVPLQVCSETSTVEHFSNRLNNYSSLSINVLAVLALPRCTAMFSVGRSSNRDALRWNLLYKPLEPVLLLRCLETFTVPLALNRQPGCTNKSFSEQVKPLLTGLPPGNIWDTTRSCKARLRRLLGRLRKSSKKRCRESRVRLPGLVGTGRERRLS
jgi:hypothetical protein